MLGKIPYYITILGMILGVIIAILFGINEDIFKNKINEGLSENPKVQQMTDETEKSAYLKVEAEKNWRYYQRFHFHSTGIGAMSLSLLVFLAFVASPAKWKLSAAYATSIGGFLYPFVWLFAGMYGPEMGRGAAKEAFAFFGYMGGVLLLGSIAILAQSVIYPVELKLTK